MRHSTNLCITGSNPAQALDACNVVVHDVRFIAQSFNQKIMGSNCGIAPNFIGLRQSSEKEPFTVAAVHPSGTLTITIVKEVIPQSCHDLC